MSTVIITIVILKLGRYFLGMDVSWNGDSSLMGGKLDMLNVKVLPSPKIFCALY